MAKYRKKVAWDKRNASHRIRSQCKALKKTSSPSHDLEMRTIWLGDEINLGIETLREAPHCCFKGCCQSYLSTKLKFTTRTTNRDAKSSP